MHLEYSTLTGIFQSTCTDFSPELPQNCKNCAFCVELHVIEKHCVRTKKLFRFDRLLQPRTINFRGVASFDKLANFRYLALVHDI